MGDETTPLIEVARAMMGRMVQRDVTTSPSHAACYASGYDDGFAAAVIEGTRDCTAEVNMAIAEKDARIAELEAQLAVRPVQGVVIDFSDEAIRNVAIRAYDSIPYAGVHTLPDKMRAAITAALSAAVIVPLASNPEVSP